MVFARRVCTLGSWSSLDHIQRASRCTPVCRVRASPLPPPPITLSQRFTQPRHLMFHFRRIALHDLFLESDDESWTIQPNSKEIRPSDGTWSDEFPTQMPHSDGSLGVQQRMMRSTLRHFDLRMLGHSNTCFKRIHRVDSIFSRMEFPTQFWLRQ